jgi:hypothetical protein
LSFKTILIQKSQIPIFGKYLNLFELKNVFDLNFNFGFKFKTAEKKFKTAQKPEMRWTSMMKISSRSLRCPPPPPHGRLPVGLACSAAARRECQYSLLGKDNIHVIKFIYLRHGFSVFTFWPYV